MNIVIGGGAAGIFAACLCRSLNQKTPLFVLEKTLKLLAKVRISGGGRCNVTHAAFDPKKLILNYPRGRLELLGPFQHFGPQEMMLWLEKRGVLLKTEEDGRMFPVTDSSETIAEALLKEAHDQGVVIQTGKKICKVEKISEGFTIHLENEKPLHATKLLLATGSHPQGYQFAKELGHTVIPPVPSLFTFNVPTSPLLDLSGITLQEVLLTLPDCGFKEKGPLLLTHFGFSGPAALKLSAFAARKLHEKNYNTLLYINWIPNETEESAFQKLLQAKTAFPQKTLENSPLFHLPAKLFKRLSQLASIPSDTPLSHLSHALLRRFVQTLREGHFLISGKTTHKQEFVTAGGICLKEIHFKTMESRIVPHLYFAGEILDVDGVTGGFNFQNAWTTGYLAGHALANRPLA